MAKKAKTTSLEPNPNAVVNRDVLFRLNFMYQAAVLLSTIIPHPPTRSNQYPPPQPIKTAQLLSTQPNSPPEGDLMQGVVGSEAREANSEAEAGDQASDRPERVPSTSSPAQPAASEVKRKRRRTRRHESESSAVLASRVLVKNMADVAKKATLRMSAPHSGKRDVVPY